MKQQEGQIRPSYPRNDEGLVDLPWIEYFLLTVAGVPLHQIDSTIDEIDPTSLSRLINQHYKNEKHHYEILANVISVGYARTQTKKKIKLFEDGKPKTRKLSPEEYKKRFMELESKMNGG